jgi:hypothetical protein
LRTLSPAVGTSCSATTAHPRANSRFWGSVPRSKLIGKVVTWGRWRKTAFVGIAISSLALLVATAEVLYVVLTE